MFRIALALIVTLTLAGAAAAQQAIRINGPFDPGRLTSSEKRLVQAALAHAGTYDALLDGAWGRGSQGALDQYVRETTGSRTPTWRDVRSLMRGFEAERQGSGWVPVWHPDWQVYHLRPDGILQVQNVGADTRYYTPDASFLLIAQPMNRRPDDLHATFLADARTDRDPYTLRTDTRMITAAQLRGGRHTYLRSDRHNGRWMTHTLVADDANQARLQLVAASFARRNMGDIAPGTGGVIAALLGGSGPALPEPDRPATNGGRGDVSLEDALEGALIGAITGLLNRDRDDRAPVATPAPAPLPDPDRGRRIATGTFVNTTDIVTTTRLDRVCDGVRIAGGAALVRVDVDRDAGVAVYAAPGRSDGWLPLDDGTPRRGDGLALLTRVGRDGDARTTRGRILREITGDGVLLVEAAPDARGAAGAPVLSSEGTLVGLWLEDRAADGLGETVTPDRLARALDGMGVPFRRGGDRRGIGADARSAVVALRCDRR
ncbi:hypothetical protein [uncultured Jannaschia sp.]|uniref:hypothetical protein n=1 Tax=uncultured Jannaschia sp. TaxID=293347 RepID=UPI00261DCB8D|nr:hypothetical protein [uncultured Jannaschia sp.]